LELSFISRGRLLHLQPQDAPCDLTTGSLYSDSAGKCYMSNGEFRRHPYSVMKAPVRTSKSSSNAKLLCRS